MIKKIAHRGLWQDKNEQNSFNAYQKAINSPNYVGFECDVRMTKDKKLVMVHDPFYKGKLISSTKRNKLNDLLSLKEVLSTFTSKMIFVDIKDPLIDLDLLHNTLESSKDNIYVISFHNNVIKNLANRKRHYKVGILNYVLNTTEDHFNYDFLCILMALSNEQIIKRYKDNKKMIIIYGVREDKIKDDYPYYIV